MERFGNNELNKDPILEDLINYFSPNEELLLKVRTLTHERTTKIYNYLYGGAIISFCTFLLIFLFFLDWSFTIPTFFHQIIFSGENTRITIPLTDINSINFIKIKQPIGESSKWKVYDGFQIYSSNNTIYFGPLDDFWDIYEVFFCYFITWKEEQDLLLSKEEIRKDNLPKLPEIDQSDQFFLPFRDHLESGEKIIIHYQTATSVKKHVRYSVIGAIAMIIAFIFTYLGSIEIFDDYYADFYSLIGGTLVGMLFLFIFLFHFIFIFQDLIRRRIHYVFTDRKLLLKYKDAIEPIKYVNIDSVTPEYRRFPRYNIELCLKNPIEISPLVSPNGYIITIPKIPIISNLNDRITQLTEGAKRQQYK